MHPKHFKHFPILFSIQSSTFLLIRFDIRFNKKMQKQKTFKIDFFSLCSKNQCMRMFVITRAGTLATCCNPSRGTLSCGWMLIRVLVWCKPDHYKGDRHKVPDHIYYMATTPGRRKPEERGQKSRSARQDAWIARSRVRFPKTAFAFRRFIPL